MAGDTGNRFTRIPAGEAPTAPLPQLLPAPDFIAQRADDAAALLESLGEVPSKPLERHLRRRGRSWRPFKYSLRARNSRLSAGKHTRKPRVRRICLGPRGRQLPVSSEGNAADDEIEVRVRRHRRRGATLLAERTWVAADWELEDLDETWQGDDGTDGPLPPLPPLPPRWLETHLWHAKRMHMEKLWGFRLAIRNANLGRRAIYRAAMQHCTLHDRSYMELFELTGPEQSIARVAELCGLSRRLVLARPMRSGLHRGVGLLRHCQELGSLGQPGSSAPQQQEQQQQQQQQQQQRQRQRQSQLQPQPQPQLEKLIAPVQFLWLSKGPALTSREPPRKGPPKRLRRRQQGQGGEADESDPLPFFLDVGEGAVEIEEEAPEANEASAAANASSGAPAPDQEPRLWIWVHPCAAAEAWEHLQRATNIVKGGSSNPAAEMPAAAAAAAAGAAVGAPAAPATAAADSKDVSMEPQPPDGEARGLSLRHLEGVVFFELTGPASQESLARALPVQAFAASASRNLWQEIIANGPGAGVRLSYPSGAVLALNVRKAFLAKMPGPASEPLQPAPTSAASAAASPQLPKMPAWLTRWPPEALAKTTIAEQGGHMPGGADIGSASASALAPTSLEEAKEDDSIPVLFVFRRGVAKDFGSGVDVLLPPRSVGKEVWLRLGFTAARVLGVHDRHALCTEVGVPDFPADFPESMSGHEAEQVAAKVSLEKHLRRPPNKRVNYALMRTVCPHQPTWGLAVQQSGTMMAPRPNDIVLAECPSIFRPLPTMPSDIGLIKPIALTTMVAVALVCARRGRPQPLCSLHAPLPSDFTSSSPTGGASDRSVSQAATWSRAFENNLDQPLPSLDQLGFIGDALEEVPLRSARLRNQKRRLKRATLKREAVVKIPEKQAGAALPMEEDAALQPLVGDAASQSLPKKHADLGQLQTSHSNPTSRPLIGFATSGCYSYRHGAGVAVGAVSAASLADCASAQRKLRTGSDTLPAAMQHWVLLLAKNPTSLVHFPVWARIIGAYEGPG